MPADRNFQYPLFRIVRLNHYAVVHEYYNDLFQYPLFRIVRLNPAGRWVQLPDVPLSVSALSDR